MKVKTFLLAGAVVGFVATSADAVEICNPFYTPAKGNFLSDTIYSFSYTKYKWKSGDEEKFRSSTLSETLYYGITDSWNGFGVIGNTWRDNQYSWTKSARDGSNPYWILGTEYSHSNDNFYAKGFLSYEQWQYFGEWGKELNFGAKFGCVTRYFTPYVFLSYQMPVDGTWNQAWDGYLNTRLGVYKLIGKIALDGGLLYRLDTSPAKNAWGEIYAGASYLFTDSISLGASAYYCFGYANNGPDISCDYFYSGVMLRIAF